MPALDSSSVRVPRFKASVQALAIQRDRVLWVALAAAGAVGVTAAFLGMMFTILPLALSADQKIEELRALSDGQFGDIDGSSLTRLRASLDSLESSVGPAAASARWMARFSPALAWAPSLDQEPRAWANQVDRLETNLDLASRLLTSSSDLMAVYGDAQIAFVSFRSPQSVADLTSRISELADALALIEEEFAAPGHRKRAEPALRPPGLEDAIAQLGEMEAAMLSASTVGRKASELLISLLDVGQRAQPLVGQLVPEADDEDAIAFDDLSAMLKEVNGKVAAALGDSRELAELISGGGHGEELLDRIEVLQDILGVLQSLNTVTLAGLQAIEPVLQSGENAGGGLLADGGAMVAALEGVTSNADELASAVALLEDAQRTLEDVSLRNENPSIAAGLAELAGVVDLVHGGLRLVVSIAPFGEDLLGASTTRSYLILGQSADELRATGGYVSALWLMSLENGGLVDLRYHDTVRVDDWQRLELYPPAPAGLEEHMNASVWLLRDVSWEPDFPTVARTAADMFAIGQRQNVDGVVAMNQWALLDIIQALGDVEAPGGGAPITSRNLLSRLETGSDEFGRAYVDLALQGVLDRLSQPLALPTLLRVASALNASLEARDLMLYTEDAGVQGFIEEIGWGGRMRQEGADYLYVVDSNVGWSKADRNIERSTRYEIDMRRESGARVSLTLAYNNHSGPGSPGCEPQWLNRGTNYSQLKNACYWDFWRVYTPHGTRLLSNTRLSLPMYSVSAEIGRGQSGEDTVKVSSSYNRTVLSGLFALGAGLTKKFGVVYDLPPEVVRRNGDQIEYELLVQKQPGSRRRSMAVEFILPPGYRLASSSVAPAFTGESRVGFQFTFEGDTVLGAVFTRSDDGAN